MVKSEHIVVAAAALSFIALPVWAKAPGAISPKAKLDASQREGRRLFLEMSCMTCHSVGGSGGNTAPALGGVGQRRTRAFIESKIRDPQAHPSLKPAKTKKPKQKSRMVQVDLFDNEIKNLTDYLMTLPKAKP